MASQVFNLGRGNTFSEKGKQSVCFVVLSTHLFSLADGTHEIKQNIGDVIHANYISLFVETPDCILFSCPITVNEVTINIFKVLEP